MRYLLLVLALLAAPLEAQQRRPLGWKSDPKHSAGLRQLVTHPRYRAAPLPPAASVKDKMPPVYDQHTLGSCVAQAAAAAFDHNWRMRAGYFVQPSRLDIYQNCLRHDGSFPRDVGTYTSSALWVLKNKGVLLERTWPYVGTNLSARAPADYKRQRQKYAAVSTYDVSNTDNGYSVKQAIANAELPVMAGGYVYEGIYRVNKSDPFIPMPAGKPIGGHEIVFVSYDDNMVHGGQKGFVEVRNSWSENDWGDKGHGWMPYAYAFNPKLFEDFGCVEVTGRRVVKSRSAVRSQSVESSPQRQTSKPSLLKRLFSR